jgi:hypothetical protein
MVLRIWGVLATHDEYWDFIKSFPEPYIHICNVYCINNIKILCFISIDYYTYARIYIDTP